MLTGPTRTGRAPSDPAQIRSTPFIHLAKWSISMRYRKLVSLVAALTILGSVVVSAQPASAAISGCDNYTLSYANSYKYRTGYGQSAIVRPGFGTYCYGVPDFGFGQRVVTSKDRKGFWDGKTTYIDHLSTSAYATWYVDAKVERVGACYSKKLEVWGVSISANEFISEARSWKTSSACA